MQVAILCNHQRAVGKAHDSQMEKMQEKLAGLREGLAELREDLKLAKAGKPKKGDDDGKPKKLDPDACAPCPNQIKSVVQFSCGSRRCGDAKPKKLDLRRVRFRPSS